MQFMQSKIIKKYCRNIGFLRYNPINNPPTDRTIKEGGDQ